MLVFGVVTTSTHAGVVHVTDPASHQLTGATGVMVDGKPYTVSFVQGSCAEIFSNCGAAGPAFAFNTFEEANNAAQALINTVFVNFEPGLTSQIHGCKSYTDFDGYECIALTPFAFELRNPPYVLEVGTLQINSDYGATNIGREYFTTDFNPGEILSLFSSGGAFAVWVAEPISEIPEPSSFALLGVAGIALAWSQRRCREKK